MLIWLLGLVLSGLFMALQPKIIACGNANATFAMAVRFLTGPAVMAAASIAVGLRGNLLRVAIVQVITANSSLYNLQNDDTLQGKFKHYLFW